MPITEGLTIGLSIAALDAHGAAASSARDADTVFVSWFCSNLSTQHDTKLTFKNGILFIIRILRTDNGKTIWQSPQPAISPDYTATLHPGDHFTIPINPQPTSIPLQIPSIPLAQICVTENIPVGQDLRLEMTVLLADGEQVSSAMLWRTPGTGQKHAKPEPHGKRKKRA